MIGSKERVLHPDRASCDVSGIVASGAMSGPEWRCHGRRSGSVYGVAVRRFFMSRLRGNDQPDVGEKPSLWTRLFRTVRRDPGARRWDRLPEGSQTDATHYNMRSGL
jgi:hypothetical protein